MSNLQKVREALEEIARSDVGGLQGIDEAHRFNPTDYSPEDAYDRLQAWRDEEVQYLVGRVSARQSKARAALALLDDLAKVDEWQPIETAPGGEVLLYFPKVVTGAHRQSVLEPMWRIARVSDTPHRKPTHWRPLPAPPALTETKR